MATLADLRKVVREEIQEAFKNHSCSKPTKPKPTPTVKTFDFRKQQKDPADLPPAQKVVLSWRELSGVREEQPWGKDKWARHYKRANELIEEMGSWEESIRCMGWVWRWCTSKNLNCTIETVVKHTDTYRREKEMGDDKRTR